jgi:hypothetical protein
LHLDPRPLRRVELIEYVQEVVWKLCSLRLLGGPDCDARAIDELAVNLFAQHSPKLAMNERSYEDQEREQRC